MRQDYLRSLWCQLWLFSLLLVAAACSDDSLSQTRQREDAAEESPLPRLFGQESGATRRQLCLTSRNAITLSAKESWHHSLTVPPRAALDVAFGLTCLEADQCTEIGRFLLQVQSTTSQPQVLLDRTINRRSDRCWQEERIDLSHLAGQRIDLSLAVETGPGPTKTAADELEPLALWAEPLWVQQSERPYYNVLLISIDTLRADRLGTYGYHRETSPHLDAFAADAVVFSHAISQAPWTTPSHMSLMTSLYPSFHGVNQSIADLRASRKGAGDYRVLPRDVPTLAGSLRESGYRTLALVGGWTLAPDFGFFQGFDVYHQGPAKLTEEVRSHLVEWLDQMEKIPFFLFFHTFEVHAPYTRLEMADHVFSREEFDRLREFLIAEPHDQDDPARVDALPRRNVSATRMKVYLEEHGLLRSEITSALYDGGIRFADEFIRWFFDELRRRGLYDRALIIVTSDHGEHLGERPRQPVYNNHGNNLYEELIRVPLILRMNGELQPGLMIEHSVELVDVAPTVLGLLGQPVLAGMQGRNLEPLLRGAGRDADTWTLSEATARGPEMKALRGTRYKYIAAFKPVGSERSGLSGTLLWEELFDLQIDPKEKRSLHRENPNLLLSMRRRLAKVFASQEARTGNGQSVAISEEIQEQLRALGYLD